MLSGNVSHQIDEKNRIRIPAKFKNAFPKGETLYYIRFNEGRVAIMPESVLNAKTSAFEDIDPSDAEAADALTILLSHIEEVTEDAQGRTQIPKWARDHAGLRKEIVSVGIRDFIEIWDQDAYNAFMTGKRVDDAKKALYKKSQTNE